MKNRLDSSYLRNTKRGLLPDPTFPCDIADRGILEPESAKPSEMKCIQLQLYQ